MFVGFVVGCEALFGDAVDSGEGGEFTTHGFFHQGGPVGDGVLVGEVEGSVEGLFCFQLLEFDGSFFEVLGGIFQVWGCFVDEEFSWGWLVGFFGGLFVAVVDRGADALFSGGFEDGEYLFSGVVGVKLLEEGCVGFGASVSGLLECLLLESSGEFGCGEELFVLWVCLLVLECGDAIWGGMVFGDGLFQACLGQAGSRVFCPVPFLGFGQFASAGDDFLAGIVGASWPWVWFAHVECLTGSLVVDVSYDRSQEPWWFLASVAVRFRRGRCCPFSLLPAVVREQLFPQLQLGWSLRLGLPQLALRLALHRPAALRLGFPLLVLQQVVLPLGLGVEVLRC